MFKRAFLIFTMVTLSACAANQVDMTNKSTQHLATICHFTQKVNSPLDIEELGIMKINGVQKNFKNPIQLQAGRYKIFVRYDHAKLLSPKFVKDVALVSMTGVILGGAILRERDNTNALKKGEFLIEVDAGKSYQMSFDSKLKSYDDLAIQLSEIPASAYRSGKLKCPIRLR